MRAAAVIQNVNIRGIEFCSLVERHRRRLRVRFRKFDYSQPHPGVGIRGVIVCLLVQRVDGPIQIV